MLETERLILRAWSPEDADALYVLAADPDVGLSTGWPPHTSVENSRQVIKDVLSVPENYAVVLKSSGELLGCMGAHPHKDLGGVETDEKELGYWIGKPFWGNGYAPEAGRALLLHLFKDLGEKACWCCHYDNNDKSRRVIEKLGFRYVATDPEHPTLLGYTRVSLMYRLTAEEYFGRK